MAPLIPSHPQTVVELRAWLDELAAGSDSITDIARTLTLVRTDPAAADVLAWAEALQACIRSHRRDVELLKPWASRRCERRDVAESMPMLGDLADIYSDLASRDSTLDQDALARGERRGQGARAAADGTRRDRGQDARRDEVRLPARSGAPTAFDRLPRD